MRLPICLAALFLAVAGSAQASLLVYEGFDYTAGSSLLGQTGGTGWNAGWTNSGSGSTVSTPGLTYTDSLGNVLQTIGNSGTFAGTNNGNFRLPVSTPETVGTSLYVSFIARMGALNAGANYAGFSLFNAGAETLFLGDPSTPTTWGIDPKGGTAAQGTTPVTTQEFLVFRIDFLASTAEIRLFENPLLTVEPTNAQTIILSTKTTALLWDQVRIQSNVAGVIDEVRIGTTYADVAPAVPEPSTCGLLLLSGMAAGVYRRRR